MKTSLNNFLRIGAILTLLLVSCNSNKKTDSEDVSPTKAVAHFVTIEDMQFNPAEITIAAGDTVVWMNKGIVTHDVSENPDKTWTSGNIEVGGSYFMVPTKDLDYFCSIHRTMTGKVRIK